MYVLTAFLVRTSIKWDLYSAEAWISLFRFSEETEFKGILSISKLFDNADSISDARNGVCEASY